MEKPIDDLKLIKDDFYWPRWPFLPLKRKNEKSSFGIETGVIHCNDKTKVVFTNLWYLPKTWEEFNKSDGVSYNTIQEMLNDSWVVD